MPTNTGKPPELIKVGMAGNSLSVRHQKLAKSLDGRLYRRYRPSSPVVPSSHVPDAGRRRLGQYLRRPGAAGAVADGVTLIDLNLRSHWLISFVAIN